MMIEKFNGLATLEKRLLDIMVLRSSMVTVIAGIGAF